MAIYVLWSFMYIDYILKTVISTFFFICCSLNYINIFGPELAKIGFMKYWCLILIFRIKVTRIYHLEINRDTITKNHE